MKSAPTLASCALCALSTLLLGCTDDPFAPRDDNAVEPLAPSFRISAPRIPQNQLPSRNGGPDFDITERADLSVTVDGEPIDMSQVGPDGRTTARFSRAPGTSAELRVEWTESVPGTSIVISLASFERTLTIEQNMSVNVGADDYETDVGPDGERDQDGDGDSNLLERTTGFSPFIGSVCPTPENCSPEIDLYLKRVDMSVTDAITMDGEYDLAWNDAEFTGRDERLFVDNFGATFAGKDPAVGRTRFADPDVTRPNFFAMNDGERLFLALLGGGDVENNTPWGDSVDPSNDDAIILYVAPDPSSDAFERIITIPLLGLNTGVADRSDSSTARATQNGWWDPDPTVLPPDLNYAACLCEGDRQFWEMSIELDTLGIVAGRPFGLEVVLIDDSNGGDSFTEWLWHGVRDSNRRVDPALVIAR